MLTNRKSMNKYYIHYYNQLLTFKFSIYEKVLCFFGSCADEC